MPKRPTRDPYTRPAINTLERLHAELGGQILENKQKHDELADQMRHVEACIKLLDPGYNLARITVKRRKPNKWFKRGTLYRRALDAMRTAAEPMTTFEIAGAVLKANGIEDASKEDVQSVALGIQHSLKNHEGKGGRIQGFCPTIVGTFVGQTAMLAGHGDQSEVSKGGMPPVSYQSRLSR